MDENFIYNWDSSNAIPIFDFPLKINTPPHFNLFDFYLTLIQGN